MMMLISAGDVFIRVLGSLNTLVLKWPKATVEYKTNEIGYTLRPFREFNDDSPLVLRRIENYT